MDGPIANFSAPKPDFASLSFCEADPIALGEWVASLPMANTAESASQLLKAATEVSRVETQGLSRFECLELIRPALHYICTRLDRMSGIASRGADSYNLHAQQLQNALVDGYKAVIRDLLEEPLLGSASREVLAQAIHRAISDMSRTMLRACQYYTPVTESLWMELHQLYQLAAEMDLAGSTCQDDENHLILRMSITNVYLRVLLLAAAKPNQLRQAHIGEIFNALEIWAPYASLEPNDPDTVFVVNPDQDLPPRYRSLAANYSPKAFGLRTEVLVYELEAYLTEIHTDAEIPDYISNTLLRHVVNAWGTMRKRSYHREPSSGPLKLCIGMRSVHYYLSGGVEFADQLGTTEALLRREINPFLNPNPAVLQVSTEKDVWQDAIDTGGARIPENPNIADPNRILLEGLGRKEASLNAPTGYRLYDAEIVDTSPNGYQVLWPQGLPVNLQTGELLALHEHSDQRWCIATVRWLRQEGRACHMGLELLSPKAIPIAARVVKIKGGPTDFARALLLPELSVIGQPAMLLTPLLPFRESQKIHIERQNIQTTAQLIRCIRITESFSQFTFRMLDGYLENAQIDMNIGALWEGTGNDDSDAPK